MDKLQDAFNYPVLSFEEGFKKLGWEETEVEDEFYYKCSCGEQIKVYGFFGSEVFECEKCGKSLTDAFSPIRTGNSTVGMLRIKDFEIEKDKDGNDRYWVVYSGR